MASTMAMVNNEKMATTTVTPTDKLHLDESTDNDVTSKGDYVANNVAPKSDLAENNRDDVTGEPCDLKTINGKDTDILQAESKSDNTQTLISTDSGINITETNCDRQIAEKLVDNTSILGTGDAQIAQQQNSADILKETTVTQCQIETKITDTMDFEETKEVNNSKEIDESKELDESNVDESMEVDESKEMDESKQLDESQDVDESKEGDHSEDANETKEDEDDDEENDDDELSDDEPHVALLERPLVLEKGAKRVKKEVVRLEFAGPAENTSKTVVITQGNGIKLTECPFIEHQLQKYTIENLSILHKILYTGTFKKKDVKTHIRQFSGFTCEKDGNEYFKIMITMGKCTVPALDSICDILGLERSGIKEVKMDRIMAFLMTPYDHKKAIPGPKQPKTSKKSSKKKSKPKSDSSSKKKRTPAEESKSTKPTKDEDEEEEVPKDDEKSGDEDDDVQEKVAEEKEESGIDNKQEKAEKKTKKQPSVKKDKPKTATQKKATPKKDAPKKDTPKKDTPKKDTSKKDTPKKDTPKKDTNKKDTPKNDTSKKDTKKTEKPASSKKAQKRKADTSTEEKNGKSKKAKGPPSNEELKEKIKKFLESADLEQVTMKTVIKDITDMYPEHDLSDKKSYMKNVVRQLIS